MAYGYNHPSFGRKSTPYSNDDYERTQAPLPTIPRMDHSSFDDRSQANTYPYSHFTPSQSFVGPSSRGDHDSDPFDDRASIPLGSRKHTSTATVAPMLSHEEDDPFVRDIDPSRPPRKRQQQSQDGWFTGRITWVVYILTVCQLGVFLAEIVKNAILTGSPIEIHPSFNPMIGPSPYVMINMGSRFDPCMHNVTGIQNRSSLDGPILWPCPNATSITAGSDGASCSLHELCGFGATTDSPAPNQWWRFIIPMFIHAGIVHIGFNLLLQMTMGRDVERLIGSVRFALVYFVAGIFGFVLGGNFAADGISSCGCSGSLFGILAITLLDLFYTWKQRPSPMRDLAFIGVDVIIAFILGLLPGLDNFSHIGGFLSGLAMGICLLRSPPAISSRRSQHDTPSANLGNRYSHISSSGRSWTSPATIFQDRRAAWWSWWVIRIVALVGALIGFILLLKNFYVWNVECSWCKYLSCLPVTVGGTNWCNEGVLNFEQNNSTSSKRDALLWMGRKATGVVLTRL